MATFNYARSRATAERLLATHQQEFPVVDAWQRVVGVLSRARLLEGLARSGGVAAVLEVMGTLRGMALLPLKRSQG